MTQPSAQSVQLTPARKLRDQEDRKRMHYRRAIEEFSEQRRLQLEAADFPDLLAANYSNLAMAAWQSKQH